MIVFCTTLIVLLAAAVALFLAAGWRQREHHAGERDRLNTAFYQQRLRELQRDETEGVVADRAQMERDLQQMLLTDVTDGQHVPARQSSRWVLLPA